MGGVTPPTTMKPANGTVATAAHPHARKRVRIHAESFRGIARIPTPARTPESVNLLLSTKTLGVMSGIMATVALLAG